MRARWEALHRAFARSVGTKDARSRFEEVKTLRPALYRFTDPDALVAYLRSRTGDLDEKDRVYVALVELVQGSGGDSGLAMALLWLGLWPALDAIHRRRSSSFRDAPDELVSGVAFCLTALVRRVDLQRLTRVAATLVRSTERDVVHGWWRARAAVAPQVPLPQDDGLLGSVASRKPSVFGLPAGLPPEAMIAGIRAWLVPVVGDDADLVLGATVYGETQRELADRLRIPHEAARKRFQRAMNRIRRRLRDDL